MEQAAATTGLQEAVASIEENNVQIGHIAFCASPADTSFISKRRDNPAKDSLGSMIQQGIVQHQLGISLNLVFLLTLAYAFFPRLRSDLEPFFRLQHQLPSGAYSQGPRDVWIVLSCIILFTGLRAFFMDYVLTPFAKRCGIRQDKAKARFAEQSYMLMYYTVFWTIGMRLFIADTPASTATTYSGWVNDLLLSMWKDFPRLTLDAGMKWYYLAQTAFWFQQVLVIHLEERRKDHWQMLTHHFVTIGLLIFSYGFRQTRVGNAILVLMDFVDLVFPLAKCLKYVGLQTACDICFGVFVLSWVVTRHFAYCAVLYSVVMHIGNTTMLFGTYDTATGARVSSDGGSDILANLLQPFLNPGAQTVQWNAAMQSVFVALLGGLQVLTCVWFVMIVKVVMRVLSGQGADDSRSDDEDEEEVDDDTKSIAQDGHKAAVEPKFIEITADSDDLYYPVARLNPSQRHTVTRRKSKGISSGLNFREHKEILNRIGCLSEEQLARERERKKESVSPQPGSSKRS